MSPLTCGRTRYGVIIVRLMYMTLAVLLVVLGLSKSALADNGTLTVFIVRHAEKAGVNRDAALSDIGKQRAARLAQMLSDAEIDHVHSTDFKRTRSTAGPTASVAGIKVTLYAPRALADLATRLRKEKGRHLVVGHTNTVLQTIELLGGNPGFPIDESSEFDRLYILTAGANGSVSTVLMRY